jgi:tetratricopeptide (TPR) repeat protein
MDKLAGAYRALGRLDEAVRLLEETHRLYQARLAPDHPDRLATMGNVALLYGEVGRWSEAIPLLRQALELKKAVHGEGHPETAIALHNLGVAYRDAGQAAEALPALEESLKLHAARQGRDHHNTLIIAFNLAWLYRDTGRLEEALSLFQDTLRRQQASGMAADHPYRLMVMNHTGTCLVTMKRYGEAGALLRECLGLRTRADPTSWWVSHTRGQLGQVAAGLGQHAEGEVLLLDAYQGLSAGKDKMPARYRGYVGDAARALADLYDAWGKKDQADEWRKKLRAHK